MDYDELHIVPSIIAETVVETPYTGQELSVQIRNGRTVGEVEKKRQKMSYDEKQKFISLCDEHCRFAYENKYDWFMKIIKQKRNKGRNQLYVWISHWLCSFLMDILE